MKFNYDNKLTHVGPGTRWMMNSVGRSFGFAKRWKDNCEG